MTLVSHRARFVFLKTHKTASTSVEAALEPLCAPPGAATGAESRPPLITEAGIIGARGHVPEGEIWRNHMSARAVRSRLGRDLWRRYLKITTVRNPYDRYVSMFFSRLSPAERAEMAAIPFDAVRRAFGAWLRSGARANMRSKLAIGPRIVVDRVLCFERLEEDFGALAHDLGLPAAPLPRFKTDRRTRAEPWVDYYDDDAASVVRRLSRFELAYFGYDRTGGPQTYPAFRRALRVAVAAPILAPAALAPPPFGDAPRARKAPR